MSSHQPDILPANAHLVGLYFQLLAAGAYFVYFPQCVIVLRRKIRDGLSIWLPAVCGLFFILTTLSIVLEMYRAYHAFGAPNATELPNPVEFYSHVSTPESLIKNSINVVQSIISDGVIVYRTFIVWNCNYWVTLVPFILFLASTAVGIWSVNTLAETKSGSILILAEVTVRVRYFYILTFCVNMLCAFLICYRIWNIGRKSSHGYNQSPLSHVMGVVIESAGLYCAYLLILIVTDCIGSNVFFIFLDPSPPVVAIVYSMLIVRAQAPREHGSTSTPMPTSLRYSATATQRSFRPQQSAIGVEINLERVVHTDLASPRSFRHNPDTLPYDVEAKGEAY